LGRKKEGVSQRNRCSFRTLDSKRRKTAIYFAERGGETKRESFYLDLESGREKVGDFLLLTIGLNKGEVQVLSFRGKGEDFGFAFLGGNKYCVRFN